MKKAASRKPYGRASPQSEKRFIGGLPDFQVRMKKIFCNKNSRSPVLNNLQKKVKIVFDPSTRILP